MSDDVVFPTSYQQWRHCIEVLGGVSLTPSYIAERLAELQNPADAKTREFAGLYGDHHLKQTIVWFQQAAAEVSG